MIREVANSLPFGLPSSNYLRHGSGYMHALAFRLCVKRYGRQGKATIVEYEVSRTNVLALLTQAHSQQLNDVTWLFTVWYGSYYHNQKKRTNVNQREEELLFFQKRRKGDQPPVVFPCIHAWQIITTCWCNNHQQEGPWNNRTSTSKKTSNGNICMHKR